MIATGWQAAMTIVAEITRLTKMVGLIERNIFFIFTPTIIETICTAVVFPGRVIFCRY